MQGHTACSPNSSVDAHRTRVKPLHTLKSSCPSAGTRGAKPARPSGLQKSLHMHSVEQHSLLRGGGSDAGMGMTLTCIQAGTR